MQSRFNSRLSKGRPQFVHVYLKLSAKRDGSFYTVLHIKSLMAKLEVLQFWI